MKAFAFVLLCALAAVQGRYTGLQSTRSLAAPGENPWVVHLRIAVRTSGLLNTCAGSLIDNRWVLTAASCVTDASFIWIRYGTVNVAYPSLVTETSLVRIDPTNTVGLVDINRIVQTTDDIGLITLGRKVGESANVCAYGGRDGPGEVLNCYGVVVSEDDEGLTVNSDDFEASEYDLGAALVSDGAQVGVLVDASGSKSKFVRTAAYAEWISGETGLNFNSEAAQEVAPEAVHFV